MDEAIDGLVADDRLTLFEFEPAGDLFRRSSHGNELIPHGFQKLARALDLALAPATPSGERDPLRRQRRVAAFRQGVAPQFPADRPFVAADQTANFRARYSR